MRTVFQREKGKPVICLLSSRDEIQARRRHRERSERGACGSSEWPGPHAASNDTGLSRPTQTQLPTASRRPLRPSALPAPRPGVAVGLSTCGGGGPCRANLWIGDPRDRIEHIVVHRHRERLVLLLDEGRDQILSPALERYPPQALR